MAVLTPKRDFVSGDTPTPDNFNYASGLLESSPTMSGTVAAGDCVADVAGTWTESQSGVAIFDGTNVIGNGHTCVLTGLTAYSRYYAQADGAIGLTATKYPVGFSLSTTQLLVAIPILSFATLTSGKITPSEADATINTQSDSYTLVLTDAGKLIKMTKATANNLTIPLFSSVAFPVGTEIEVVQYGAGTVTIVATGGVTLRSADSLVDIAAQYASVGLKCIAQDEWLITGYLA